MIPPRYNMKIIRCGFVIDAETGEARDQTPEEEAQFLRAMGLTETQIAAVVNSPLGTVDLTGIE